MNFILSSYNFLYQKRELIFELAKRELKNRHAGQLLGALWAYGHPLIIMLIYTILFSYVFPTRYIVNGSTENFAVNVFAGIVPWLAFQDILTRSPNILTSHANMVKQIVFPTEVLPIKTTLASVMPYSVSTIFAIIYAFLQHKLTYFALMLPLIVILQIGAMIGVAFLLSLIGVFFKDIKDIITVFCSINLFAQPILFNPHAIPHWLQVIFLCNPFSYLTWCWQDALYYGRFAHPLAWIIFPIMSILILIIGVLFFKRLKMYFGDAL